MALSQLKEKIEEAKLPYKVPKEGWTCFHCGENFKDFKKAQEHFGLKKDMTCACVLKICKDPCLVMELRKAEKLTHEREQRIKELEKEHGDLRSRYDLALRDLGKT